MLHTSESNFSNFVIEYLGKIETEFENTLARLSGAQMGSNHEKTEGRKSRDTLPLKTLKMVIFCCDNLQNPSFYIKEHSPKQNTRNLKLFCICFFDPQIGKIGLELLLTFTHC